MEIQILPDRQSMGAAAAEAGAQFIRNCQQQGEAVNLILATGASQFEMLASLVHQPGIDWSRITCFHLDEYIGLPMTHPASFRKYLKERFVDQLPGPLAAFHFVDGENDPLAECERLAGLISDVTINVAFVGIGENGHLAFNDPPADLNTEKPYLVVELDEACRNQQFGEGWFDSLDEVPRKAISMSIRQILKADRIICTVPDERKAQAVRNSVEGPVTPDVPASVLQQHPATKLFLDSASASLLSQR